MNIAMIDCIIKNKIYPESIMYHGYFLIEIERKIYEINIASNKIPKRLMTMKYQLIFYT